jgi:hypothetical protein
VSEIYPEARTQTLPTAPYVHVFDAEFLQEDFWPTWCEIVREVNAKVANRPLENNAKRGICDEITARFKSECAMSSRQTYGDSDVGPGMLEASLFIPHGYSLNHVPGFGAHRTAIVAVTSDGANWHPVFVEPQLGYAQFKTTSLPDAAAAGVSLVECWV